MSSVKPPGGKPPIDSIPSISPEPGVSEAPESASNLRPDAVAGLDPGVAAGQTHGAELSAIDALASDVAAGRISSAAAIDALVQNALADVAGVLSAEQRRDLEATLRASLADDPTLAALRHAWDT